MILDRIIGHKKLELLKAERQRPLAALKKQAASAPAALNLQTALVGGCSGKRKIIAEVKKASPSKGIIRDNFKPVEIACEYEAGGAAAISVLTDEKFFCGSKAYLADIKGRVSVPVLRKDFLIAPYQVYESRACGADALLLIAAVLAPEVLSEMLELTCALGMQALVEIHSEPELEKVLKRGAAVIGINNRDLKTFKTDIETTLSLIKKIPSDRTIVAESGISTVRDIQRLAAAGVHAFLIGEALMREEHPGQKLRELVGQGHGAG